MKRLFSILSFLLLFQVSLAAKDNPLADTTKWNVFAVVSGNIEDAARQASEALVKKGFESFPAQGMQVHCTFYLTRFSNVNKDKILNVISETASETKKFSLETDGLHITNGNWVFINLKKDALLQNLADTIVTKLEKYRFNDGFIPKWVEDYPEKKKNIADFGSPNVFSSFEPHLTLVAGNDKGELLSAFVKENSEKEFAKTIKGQLIGIGLGKADRNGQIEEVEKIFYLK